MSNQSSSQCPKCDAALPANAPAGLCPNCLMALNLKTESVLSGEAAPARPPMPPEEIAPHFPHLEILECLGRGGMGVVYKARQKSLNRLVALKLLAPERAHDPQFADRFEKEARALAALNHPNIVTIHDHGQAGGFYYLLMEYVDGVTLRQLLLKERMAAREALAIVPQICDALQYAHDAGIVHRDIKPENILLDRRGRVKVADFGLAKLVAARDEPPARPSPEADDPAGRPYLTEAGRVMGTPQYMAPEQVEHPQAVDHRADIYSLGVVFYQMLTGELPGQKLEPPSRKVVIDVRLDEVVLRALEKEPERRYQQVSDVKTMVETIATTPSPVPPAGTGGSPVREQPKPSKPGGGLVFGVAMVHAVMFALVAGFFVFVTPRYVAVFKDMAMALPVPTMVVLSISKLMKQWWFVLVPLLAGLNLLVLLGLRWLRIRALFRTWAVAVILVGVAIVSVGFGALELSVKRVNDATANAEARAEMIERQLKDAIQQQLNGVSVRCDQLSVVLRPDGTEAYATLENLQELQGIAGSNVWVKIHGSLVARYQGEGNWEVLGTDQLGHVRFTAQTSPLPGAATAARLSDNEMRMSARDFFYDLMVGNRIGKAHARLDRLQQSQWGEAKLQEWWRTLTVAMGKFQRIEEPVISHEAFGMRDATVLVVWEKGRLGFRISFWPDGKIAGIKLLPQDTDVVPAPRIVPPLAGSPSQLGEPPQLRFLAWQDENRNMDNWRAWHPDGTPVVDSTELGWLDHTRATPVDVSSTQWGKQNPRFLFLWFSHPAFEGSSYARVTLFDADGKRVENVGSSVGQGVDGPRGSTGNLGWLTHTMSPGYFANMPATVNVRLEYGIGPWTVRREEIPATFSGSISLHNKANLVLIGQTAKGEAFVTMSRTDGGVSDKQLNFVALTKDGRQIERTGQRLVGQENSMTETFEFPVKLEEIKAFQFRTRPIKTVEFKNVPLPSQAPAPATGPLSFGPVIERVSGFFDQGLEVSYLDLDTGKTVDRAPPGDFGVGLGESHSRARITLGMKVKEVVAEKWECSREELARTLLPLQPPTKATRVGGSDEAKTYFFQTREGSMGVLQILDATHDEGHGRLKIRYKLVQNPAGTPGAESSTKRWLGNVPGGLEITGPAEGFTQARLRGWVEQRWRTEYPGHTHSPLEWGRPEAIASEGWVTIRVKYIYTTPYEKPGKAKLAHRYYTFTKAGDFCRSDFVDGPETTIETPSAFSPVIERVISFGSDCLKFETGELAPLAEAIVDDPRLGEDEKWRKLTELIQPGLTLADLFAVFPPTGGGTLDLWHAPTHRYSYSTKRQIEGRTRYLEVKLSGQPAGLKKETVLSVPQIKTGPEFLSLPESTQPAAPPLATSSWRDDESEQYIGMESAERVRRIGAGQTHVSAEPVEKFSDREELIASAPPQGRLLGVVGHFYIKLRPDAVLVVRDLLARPAIGKTYDAYWAEPGQEGLAFYNPPTKLRAARPSSTKLEFRIAPKASDLEKAELASCRDTLKAGQVGLWWRVKTADGHKLDLRSVHFNHLWLPVAGEWNNAAQLVTGEFNGQKYVLVSDKPGQTMTPGEGENGWGLARVYAAKDNGGRPVIGFELNERGGELLTALTKANLNRALAIAVDGKVVSAPVIMAPMSKTGMITGNFTEQEANQLVETIRGGMCH